MRDTTSEARAVLKVTLFYGNLHRDVPVLTDQRERIYTSSRRRAESDVR